MIRTHVILKSEVGARYIQIGAEVYSLSSSIGYIQPQDEGKRITVRKDGNQTLIYLESQAQFRARLATKEVLQ